MHIDEGRQNEKDIGHAQLIKPRADTVCKTQKPYAREHEQL